MRNGAERPCLHFVHFFSSGNICKSRVQCHNRDIDNDAIHPSCMCVHVCVRSIHLPTQVASCSPPKIQNICDTTRISRNTLYIHAHLPPGSQATLSHQEAFLKGAQSLKNRSYPLPHLPRWGSEICMFTERIPGLGQEGTRILGHRALLESQEALEECWGVSEKQRSQLEFWPDLRQWGHQNN